MRAFLRHYNVIVSSMYWASSKVPRQINFFHKDNCIKINGPNVQVPCAGIMT
ncbi:hypothetical protein Hanom_Chr09g00862241 [Helianthus anomalus]